MFSFWEPPPVWPKKGGYHVFLMDLKYVLLLVEVASLLLYDLAYDRMKGILIWRSFFFFAFFGGRGGRARGS